MSLYIPPQRGAPEGATTQTPVNSNRNQMWYQKLCRAEHQQLFQNDPNESSPSPQRLQLQLHFQREYQQRQELQKNCRQEWWQRKSGASSPINYRTPSPGRKFYSGAPVYYRNAPRNQPPPNAMPRTLGPQPSPKSYYQPATADMCSISAECRRRIERDLIDHEREKMIKAAQVIKHDAEKRIRQAKREIAASSDQENIQRLLLQLLKEQDLAQKLQASNQTPPIPAPMLNLSVDLQYKLATLLQAYQPLPSQQLSTNYQKKWQEQIGTYKDMLQEYRMGNFFQSHQKAKRLLQLLLQNEPTSAQVRIPPRIYPAHSRQDMYQQFSDHAGYANAQPFFKAPLPPQPIRSRRDPRLNRSSQYYTRANDITPRLNQSSFQYSEQDITPEIIYQGDISGKTGILRRNSTPRKQSEEKRAWDGNVGVPTEGMKKQQSEQHVTYADNRERDFQKRAETPVDHDVAQNYAPIASDEYMSDSLSESKEYMQDWEQLQQRSRYHRRRRGSRRSSEDRLGSGQTKSLNGTEKSEQSNAVAPNLEGKNLSARQKHNEYICRENSHMINSEYRKAFPDREVQAEVCTESFNQQETDHQTEGKDIQTGAQNKHQCAPSDGDQTNQRENGIVITSMMSKTDVMNGISKTQLSSSVQNAHEFENQDEINDHVKLKDRQNSEVSYRNETAMLEKEDNLATTQRTKTDAPHSNQTPSDVTLKEKRQSSEPQQVRLKPQPSPQLQKKTQSRGQTSRYPPPQQSQRAPKPQPSLRAVRQSPAGPQKSSGNLRQTADAASTSQNSQKLAESRSNRGMKSSEHEAPENISKSPGSFGSKQGSKRSPGNTYVIRNSGQRFPSKAPSEAQRGKPGSTKSQSSSVYNSKNSSPNSTESKSPPEHDSKAQVSPPSGKTRRRRYRRKPWERDDTDSFKLSRSSSAVPSQHRFQDRSHDHSRLSRWLSPSRRWMAPSSTWESQPRRCPYQWEDSKTAPVQKWRAFGQPGGKLPNKTNPPEKELIAPENKPPPKVSSHVTPVPEKDDRVTKSNLQKSVSDETQSATGHQDADDKEKYQPEQISMSENEEPTLNRHYDARERKEIMENKSKERKVEEQQNYTQEPEIQTTIESSGVEKLQTPSVSQDSVSDALDVGFETSTGIPASQTDPASGKETFDTSTYPASSAEIQVDSYTAAREEERSQTEFPSLMVTKPETLLEHVLAVLGKKAARDAEEPDSEDEDGLYQQQSSDLDSRTPGASEGTRDASSEASSAQDGEISQEQAHHSETKNETAVSKMPASRDVEEGTRPDNATHASKAEGSSATESLLATSAKILRLEEMEDWQTLDIPNQEKNKSDMKNLLSHQKGLFVMSDQHQEKMKENQETTKCSGGGSSAENEHMITPEDQTGNEVGQNHYQKEQEAIAVENSERLDKIEDQHRNAEEELVPGENNAGIASVQENSCHYGSKEMKESAVLPEQETLSSTTQLLENGKIVEVSDHDMLNANGKQDEQSTEDTQGMDLPESRLAEDASNHAKISESAPETKSHDFCAISVGENKNQENSYLNGCRLPADCEKESCTLLQHEKPYLKDHCSELSSHEDDPSSFTANANGYKEIGTTENTDNCQKNSVTKEVQNKKQAQDSGITAIVADLEQTASSKKSVCMDSTGVEFVQPRDTCALRDQPDLHSFDVSCQDSSSDVDLNRQEKAVISPLSSLARCVVIKFCNSESLTMAVSKVASGSPSPAMSSAKNLEFDNSNTTGSKVNHVNATSPTVTNANLTNRGNNVSNSVKKNMTNGGLESSLGDKGTDNVEGYEETWKDPSGPSIKLKSPPVENSGFCCGGLDEANEAQITTGLCPKCGRPKASQSLKKSNMAFGEILHDKLTAFGYL